MIEKTESDNNRDARISLLDELYQGTAKITITSTVSGKIIELPIPQAGEFASEPDKILGVSLVLTEYLLKDIEEMKKQKE